MNKQPTKVTLKRHSQYGWYSREELYNPDDELLILEQYFPSAVGYDPKHFSMIKKLILEGIVAAEPIGVDIIDGKFQFYHLYIDNLKEPRISQNDLLELIEKWYELVSAKVDQIVITNDNGKFSIGTE